MADITRLTDQLHTLDVAAVVPACGPKSAFGYSVIGGNQIGPNTTRLPSTTTSTSLRSVRDANPLYDPNLELPAAAKYLYKILKAALTACKKWLEGPVEEVKDVVTAKGGFTPFVRMCQDFDHIFFFLQHGRRGWDLTFLPDNFFVDAGGVLADLVVKLQKISEIEGCKVVLEKAAKPVRGIKQKLEDIKALRKRIWEQTKMVYGHQEQAKLANVEAEKKEEMLIARPKVRAVSRKVEGYEELLVGVDAGPRIDMAFGEEREFRAGGGLGGGEVQMVEGAQEAVVGFENGVAVGNDVEAASTSGGEAPRAEEDSERLLGNNDIDPELSLLENK